MSKKTEAPSAAADVDDLLGDDTAPAKKAKGGKAKAAAAAPAKKAKGGKAAAAAPAKKGKAKAEAAAPAKKGKGKAKAEKKAVTVSEDSPLRKAMLKVKKAVSYADFSEANGFNIRTVRRTARALRDAGEIELTKEGTTVFIGPAV